MEKPLVSIIIPTYNRSQLISHTLDSVANQTFQNWECIVVDDGSIDETQEVVSRYCNKDQRFKFYHRPKSRKKNASTCRNYGFERSNGSYIQYLDSDDLIAENKLQKQLDVLTREKKSAVAFCNWAFLFQDSGKLIFQNNTTKNFECSLDLFEHFGQTKSFLPSHAYLVPRSLVIKAGCWNEYLDLNDDGEFFARVLLNASKIIYIPSTMVYYRTHKGASLSTYTNFSKANRGILSWKLIEANLKIKYPEAKLVYVEQAKESIYKVVHRKLPEVVEANKDFFQKQISQKKLYNRIFRRLKKYF